jgi:glycosyltransferase involved in cell wall biosynthesis
MTQPVLSVVVIGRNEGDRLVRCLESVRAVRGLDGPIEIIYADSASSDGSPARAAAHGARVVAVDATARPTAALGRNTGWRVATADLILFLDGDTVLHPDFPRRAADALGADPRVAAAWGHRRELHPEHSIYNRVLDLDWIFKAGFTEYCGGDVLMRRCALEEVGGYDGTLIAGEEPELCRRLRARDYRILHIDAPMTGHDLAMTRFEQYWKRSVRTGHAYAEVSKRFRGSADPLWRRPRLRNLQRGTFWALTPVVAVGASFAAWTPLPVLAWLSLLAIVTARSAWKARWKTRRWGLLALYGLHSHLQQIPVLVGQLQQALGARRGERRGLIEYKEPGG